MPLSLSSISCNNHAALRSEMKNFLKNSNIDAKDFIFLSL